jgi:hypothetical protein
MLAFKKLKTLINSILKKELSIIAQVHSDGSLD